jgi:hypothetical protein
MQQEFVNIIVYFYIFVCLALLVFNVLYILRSKRRGSYQERQTKAMAEAQRKVLEKMGSETVPKEAHVKFLTRCFKKAAGLLAFEDALEQNRKIFSREKINEYLMVCSPAVLDTAAAYQKHPAMERAFFAYFVSVNFSDTAEHYRRLGETLLLYLEDSTIYCRENVLRALYSLGAGDALERALLQFQAKGWYHHPRLISDGLMTFQGDREWLARRLWKNERTWDEHILVALVQFMTNLPEDFSDLMFPALQSRYREVRFAVIRYYQHHPVPEAKPVLIELVRENEDLAIAASLALEAYPGEDTKEVLKQAMRSTNWYVRRNAAMALLHMGISPKEQEALSMDEDRYAREMFVYVLNNWKRRSR